MVVMVVILFMNYSTTLVWWLRLYTNLCVSSGTERNELDSSSIDRTWVRMCDVRYCTARYMFDDWIDNIVVATQQQMWVV